MSLSYLGLLDTVLLSSVGSIITPCNLCEVLPTVTVQCDSPSFYPYSPKCVEVEFSAVHIHDPEYPFLLGWCYAVFSRSLG